MSKTVKDMTNFETGAVRDTGGKGRMDLLPMCALLRISKHMENALTHYPERNWERGLPMHSMLDSALRHLVKYMDGQTDEDHLCAATTNLLMAMWTEEKLPGMQDIPSRRTFMDDVKELVENIDKPKTSYSVCPYWVIDCGEYRCYGTKERDICVCGGDKFKCDFCPEKRNG